MRMMALWETGLGPRSAEPGRGEPRSTDERSGRVLIILHQRHSTPGRVGRLLQSMGYTLEVRRPRFEDVFPETMRDVALARGNDVDCQALRSGKHTFGLQFHPELTYAMMSRGIVHRAARAAGRTPDPYTVTARLGFSMMPQSHAEYRILAAWTAWTWTCNPSSAAVGAPAQVPSR